MIKKEEGTQTDSHNLKKRHKPGKRQPLPKGPRYECYTFLTTNQATILEEAFNIEISIQLSPIPPPKPKFGKTKHYRNHHSHGQYTEDCLALKGKIEELIQAGYLAQFRKKIDNNSTGA